MPRRPTGNRPGRPTADEPRRNVTSVRLSDDEQAEVSAAATLDGKHLGPWMREAALDYAKRSQKRARRREALQGPSEPSNDPRTSTGTQEP